MMTYVYFAFNRHSQDLFLTKDQIRAFTFHLFCIEWWLIDIFYNKSSKFAICQCPRKHIRTHNNMCNA